MGKKVYTTYAVLTKKGKKVGRKYKVNIEATSRESAIRKAKAYHRGWNKVKSNEGYTVKFVGSKKPTKKKTRKVSSMLRPTKGIW